MFTLVVKNGYVKRGKLLKEEIVSSRTAEASNSICLSDLQGFCCYSVTKFQDRLDGKLLYLYYCRCTKSFPKVYENFLIVYATVHVELCAIIMHITIYRSHDRLQ